MAINYKVRGDNVLIRVKKATENKTESGLILTSEAPIFTGFVEGYGGGVHDLYVGDEVLLNFRDTNKTEEADLVVVKSDNILAVITRI